MQTRAWGPWAWAWLHGWASAYDPTSMRAAYEAVLKTTLDILPCTYCRSSCRAFVHGASPSKRGALESRERLEAWWYDVHCMVNGKLGEPEAACPSLKTVRRTYRGKAPAATQEAFWHLAFMIAGNYGGNYVAPDPLIGRGGSEEGVTVVDQLVYASWWRAVGILALQLAPRMGRAILEALAGGAPFPSTRAAMVGWTFEVYRLSGGAAPLARVGVLIESSRAQPH